MDFPSSKIQTASGRLIVLGLLGIALLLIVGYLIYQSTNLSNKIVPPSYKGPVPDGVLTRLGKGGISIIAVSPDGNYLAVGNQIGIYLYNANTFEQLWVNPCGSIRFLEFSPNSRLLIGISLENETYQRTISKWDVKTGDALSAFDFFTEFNLYDLYWQSNQNPLLAIERHHIIGQSKEGLNLNQWSVHFIDIVTAKSWQVFTTQSVIDSFSFSPDGTTIAYSMTSEGVNIWDIVDDKEITNIHLPNYITLSFSSNGKMLLATTPGPIYVFDPTTGDKLGQLDDSRHAMNLHINQDGTMVVGAFDKKVVMWSLPGMVEIKSWAVDSDATNFVWGMNSSMLFIQTSGSKVEVWDVTREKLLRTLGGHVVNEMNLVWSPDSILIATTTYSYDDKSSLLLVWNLEGDLIRRIEYPGSIGVMAWSPDNKKIVISNNGHLIFLASRDFSLIKTIELDSVIDLDWSPNGEQIAAALADRKVSILDFSTGDTLFSMTTLPQWMPTPEFLSNPVISVSWSPFGDRISAGMFDGPAYIWDAGGKQLAELNHNYTSYSYMNSVVDVSWSLDGRYLAGGFNSGVKLKTSENGAVYFVPGEAVTLWDAQTGQPYKILEAYYESVGSIDWSPNSSILAVSLNNKASSSLYLWNTDDSSNPTASELPELKIDGGIYEIAWAPNGKMLAALLDDGTIVVWDFGK